MAPVPRRSLRDRVMAVLGTRRSLKEAGSSWDNVPVRQEVDEGQPIAGVSANHNIATGSLQSTSRAAAESSLVQEKPHQPGSPHLTKTISIEPLHRSFPETIVCPFKIIPYANIPQSERKHQLQSQNASAESQKIGVRFKISNNSIITPILNMESPQQCSVDAVNCVNRSQNIQLLDNIVVPVHGDTVPAAHSLDKSGVMVIDNREALTRERLKGEASREDSADCKLETSLGTNDEMSASPVGKTISSELKIFSSQGNMDRGNITLRIINNGSILQIKGSFKKVVIRFKNGNILCKSPGAVCCGMVENECVHRKELRIVGLDACLDAGEQTRQRQQSVGLHEGGSACVLDKECASFVSSSSKSDLKEMQCIGDDLGQDGLGKDTVKTGNVESDKEGNNIMPGVSSLMRTVSYSVDETRVKAGEGSNGVDNETVRMMIEGAERCVDKFKIEADNKNYELMSKPVVLDDNLIEMQDRVGINVNERRSDPVSNNANGADRLGKRTTESVGISSCDLLACEIQKLCCFCGKDTIDFKGNSQEYDLKKLNRVSNEGIKKATCSRLDYNYSDVVGDSSHGEGEACLCPEMDNDTGRLDQICPQMDYNTGGLDQICPQINYDTGRLDQICPQINYDTGRLDQICPQINYDTGRLDQICPDGSLHKDVSEDMCRPAAGNLGKGHELEDLQTIDVAGEESVDACRQDNLQESQLAESDADLDTIPVSTKVKDTRDSNSSVECCGPVDQPKLMQMINHETKKLNKLSTKYKARVTKVARLQSYMEQLKIEKDEMSNLLLGVDKDTAGLRNEAAELRCTVIAVCDTSVANIGRDTDARRLEPVCFRRYSNIRTSADASNAMSSVRTRIDALCGLEVLIYRKLLTLRHVLPSIHQEKSQKVKSHKTSKLKHSEQLSHRASPQSNLVVKVESGLNNSSDMMAPTDSPYSVSTPLMVDSD